MPAMNESTRRRISVFQLLLASAIWGFAFVAQRAGMEYVGPFTFNGIRFLLGSAVLVPFLLLRRDRAESSKESASTRCVAWGIGLAGLVLFAAASLQQIGVVYTTAGKAGFITGLYVVIVPLLGLLRRHRVGPPVWLGAILSVGGLYLLSVTGRFDLGLGDGLVLASAFGWAIHVHVIGWLAGRARALRVAAIQFAICGALSLVVALLAETIAVDRVFRATIPILYAGLLSTGVAYTLQVVAQRRVDPTRAGILLSLEGAFAVLGGWLLLGETMTGRMLAGCGLMLLGMMASQVRASKRGAAL
jgi:drug/metabolite transporter (DMT)-like permease